MQLAGIEYVMTIFTIEHFIRNAENAWLW